MSDNPGFRPAHGASPRFISAAWRGYSIFFGGICRRPIADRIRTRPRVWAEPQWPLKRRGFGSRRPRRSPRRPLGSRAPEQLVAYVNLARLAVEAAALDLMQLVQRSVGLQAFMRPNPIERISRDLATYLRQPGPDRALDRRGGMDTRAARGRAGSLAMTAGEAPGRGAFVSVPPVARGARRSTVYR